MSTWALLKEARKKSFSLQGILNVIGVLQREMKTLIDREDVAEDFLSAFGQV